MVIRYIIARQPLTPPTIETRDGWQKVRRGPRARFYRGVDGVVWQGWRFKAWQFLTEGDAEAAREYLKRREDAAPTNGRHALTIEPLRFWRD